MMNEKELVNRIVRGERDLFRSLVEEHQNMVFRTCMGFVHDKDDADDLTQEVFIQAYQSLEKFKGDSLLSTWLYRIAVNTSLNRVRKNQKSFFIKRIGSLLGAEGSTTYDIPVLENEDPESILIREEHSRWVRDALNKLPDRQKTAIVLSKYDDLSQNEIAGIMEITEGAVEALIQRAKANLRKNLSNSSKKNKMTVGKR